MLKIRLQRIGRKNDPAFRVVVTEHTAAPKSGKFIERLGSYNPKTKERQLNEERVNYWLSVGAKASGTMHNMLISAGLIKGEKVNVLPKKTPIVKEEPVVAEAAPAEEAPSEEEAAPAEDVPVATEVSVEEEKPAEEATA